MVTTLLFVGNRCLLNEKKLTESLTIKAHGYRLSWSEAQTSYNCQRLRIENQEVSCNKLWIPTSGINMRSETYIILLNFLSFTFA